MTNREAIKQLVYVRRNLDEYLDEDRISTVNIAISALEENDKLKADVEQFSNELISVRIENELLKKKNELTNYYFEQYSAAIDEIEQLKEVRNKYGLLLEMYDKKQKEIEKLKSELEQLVKQYINVERLYHEYYDLHKKGGVK